MKGLRSGLGLSPIAHADTRPGHPDFADPVWRAGLAGVGVHDDDLMVCQRTATADDLPSCFAGLGRGHVAGGQGVGVHGQHSGQRVGPATGDDQRGFRQAIAGKEGRGLKAAGGKGIGKAGQRLGPHRFRTDHGDLPLAQIQGRSLGRGDALHAQIVGEGGGQAVDGPVAGDGLEPQKWSVQKGRGGHQNPRAADHQPHEQKAHQPHVVIGGQPGDAHWCRGPGVKAQAAGRIGGVGQKLGVGEEDALGLIHGPGGELDQGRVFWPDRPQRARLDSGQIVRDQIGDCFQPRNGVGPAFQLTFDAPRGQDHPWLGGRQDAGQPIPVAVQLGGIARDGDGPGHPTAQQTGHEVQPRWVGQEYGLPKEIVCLKLGGDGSGLTFQLRIGQPPAFGFAVAQEDEGGSIPVGGCQGLDGVDKGEGHG